jgi:hypothetical protein
MNIASITQARRSESNLAIEVVTDLGDKVTINVSPPAVQSLLQALLSPSPKSSQVLYVSGCQAAVLENSIPAIDYLLGESHLVIAFHPKLLPAVQAVFDDLAKRLAVAQKGKH